MNLVNHIRRDILGGSLDVVAKELFSVDSYRFDLLAIDGDFALFVHLNSVHFFEQFLYIGSFANLVGSSIVLYGIALDCHLRRLALDADFGKMLHLFVQANDRNIEVVIGHIYLLRHLGETHRGDNQAVFALGDIGEHKKAIIGGLRTLDKRGIQ